MDEFENIDEYNPDNECYWAKCDFHIEWSWFNKQNKCLQCGEFRYEVEG